MPDIAAQSPDFFKPVPATWPEHPCSKPRERAQPAEYKPDAVPTPSEFRVGDVRGFEPLFLCALVVPRRMDARPLEPRVSTRSRRGHKGLHTQKTSPWNRSTGIIVRRLWRNTETKHRLDNTPMWAPTGGKLPRRARGRFVQHRQAFQNTQVRTLRLKLQPAERGPGTLSLFCQPSRPATRRPLSLPVLLLTEDTIFFLCVYPCHTRVTRVRAHCRGIASSA